MEKQIEEMANDIAKICPDLVENCCGQVNCVTHLTLSLHNAGYRKQSEGEWQELDICVEDMYCSVCGGIAPVDCEKEAFYKSNFCPNCGAHMSGGNKDE